MKKYLLIASMMTVISACASNTPQLTLDEKLQGTSGKERKEILRLACLNEAEWPIYTSSTYKSANFKQQIYIKNRYNPEVSEMKALCRKMDKPEKEDKAALFKDCKQKIADKSEKHGDKATGHTQRILKICKEMTVKNKI